MFFFSSKNCSNKSKQLEIEDNSKMCSYQLSILHFYWNITVQGSEYSGILMNFCVFKSMIVLVIASVVINDSDSGTTKSLIRPRE